MNPVDAVLLLALVVIIVGVIAGTALAAIVIRVHARGGRSHNLSGTHPGSRSPW